MVTIQSEEELQEWLTQHADEPVLVFKHSTTCPISAGAFRQVTQFEQETSIPVCLIRVIEERPVSNHFASTYGVRHESPQAIVLRGSEVVWHKSHYDITADALKEAVQNKGCLF